MSDKPKICFVVQRYGEEIVGGAEALCKSYAEALTHYYEVDVATSCAVDYDTWENYYPEQTLDINGVLVFRYAAKHPRRNGKIGPLTTAVYENPDNTMALGRKWLKEVGPYCPGILRHIRRYKKGYSIFIFVGYHYYNSTFGLPLVPEKAIFLPTAHDEAPIRKCNYFKRLFSLPRAFIFLSGAERDFVREFFSINPDIPDVIAGAWVEPPGADVPNPAIGEYIAYAGRIDETKNCGALLDAFMKYKAVYGGDLRLALMGKAYMDLPQRDDIDYLGYVGEAGKFAVLRGARAFVMPSENESLSISALEAMRCGTPVVANCRSEVLRQHMEISGGGLCYDGAPDGFANALDSLLHDDVLRARLGGNGIKYVSENYSKRDIIERLRGIIDNIAHTSR